LHAADLREVEGCSFTFDQQPAPALGGVDVLPESIPD
jgi:hypothetical protein